MHAIDATSAVIFDSWGLTTIDFASGKVRIEKATSGDWLSSNGGTALVHNERGNKRVARSIPSLSQVKLASGGYDLKYQHLGMLSDGARAVKADGDELKLIALGSGKETKLALGTATKLKPFILGPRLDPFIGEYEQEIFIGSDDSFVLLTGDGTVRGGRIGKKVEHGWTATCGFPQGVLRVRPHADGTFISAWHPALNRSFCALITGGKTLSVREVETISPAVFDGRRLVYQPTEAQVVRELWNGQEAERFDLKSPGAGELLAEGDHALIVTADREAVHELSNGGRVFDRRLGDTSAPVRPVLRALEARFNRLARVANQVVTQNALFLPQYGRGLRPGYHFGHGDLGFLRLIVSAWVVNTLRTENGGQFSLGSYSNPTVIRPIDAKELARDFAALDAEGVDFLQHFGFLQHPLEECFGGSFNDEKKVKVKPPMQRDAEQLLLNAIIARRKAKGRVELAPNVAKWSKQKLTPASFIKELDPVTEDEGWFDAQTSVAWLVLDFFGEDALDVMIDWFAVRPSSMVRSNAHIIGAVPKRMLKQYPATKKPFADAVAKAVANAKGEDDTRFFTWLQNELVG
ncbi:MAG: hypothetical protein U0228_01740 [Myxococcaceae bacterium]